MTGKTLFGVVVRAVGLWLLLRGLGGLLSGLIGAAAVAGLNTFGFPGGWLMSAIQLLGGLYLLRAAPAVVRFAYASDDEHAPAR
jgi:hypothetical protein